MITAVAIVVAVHPAMVAAPIVASPIAANPAAVASVSAMCGVRMAAVRNGEVDKVVPDDGGVGDGGKRYRARGQGQQHGTDEYESPFHGNVSFPFQGYGEESRLSPDTFLHEIGTDACGTVQCLQAISRHHRLLADVRPTHGAGQDLLTSGKVEIATPDLFVGP